MPKADFHGDDALAFRVVQSGITSQKAVIQLTVESVNDVPEALPSEWVVEEDGSLLVEVSGRDLEEDTLTFQLVEGPSHGELEGTLPEVFYRPYKDYFGEDAWSFRVFDGQDTSEAATVLVEVTPVADRPVGLPQVVELLENEAPLIELYGEDPDGDSLTFETVEAPAHGVLTGAPPLLTYVPELNFNGTDRFSYRVSAGSRVSEVYDISLLIAPQNSAPLLQGATVKTPEDVGVWIPLLVSDPEDDPVFFELITQAQHGTVTVQEGVLRYVPEDDFFGSDVLKWWQATDLSPRRWSRFL